MPVTVVPYNKFTNGSDSAKTFRAKAGRETEVVVLEAAREGRTVRLQD